MHLPSFVALALLASPSLAHAGKRSPLDESLVNASLFERYVASHLRTRRPVADTPVNVRPAVYRPRKLTPEEIAPVVAPPKKRAPSPFVATSHHSHQVWRPVTAAPVVSKRTAAEEHQRKVSYRNAYLARAAAKRRGLVAEAVSAPSKALEQRAASDFPSPARSLVKRGLVTDAEEAWSKVKREFERDLEQEEGDVVEDTEEDWSWMDHGESSEGDEEESAGEGSLRRRSAELIDEGPVMRMETRMKKASPLM